MYLRWILPILKSIGIDKSGLPMEEDVLEYTQSIKDVTLDDIKKEFITYVRKMVK